MKLNFRDFALLAAAFVLIAMPALGQTGEATKISSGFALFVEALDTKTAKEGQEVQLQTVGNVTVNGRIIIPEKSKIIGHVTQVTTSGKDQTQSAVAIVIDKAVRTDGISIDR